MSVYPQLKVSLISFTNNPEQTCAIAANLCYSSLSKAELIKSLSASKIEQLLDKIIDLGHLSVLEHATFSFLVEGISRISTHQLIRHRIGCSYSQRSQRYVLEENPEFIVPQAIKNTAKEAAFIEYCQQGYQLYSEQIACDVPKEAARYLFPQAIASKIFVSMNARALYHFFALRMCSRAQDEIRTLACKMLAEVKKVAPVLFKKAGASCEFAHCPEGEKSCGRGARK